MPDCIVTLSVNNECVMRSARVQDGNKGRTKHDIVLKNLTSEQNTVEVAFDQGYGVLFLWYFELLVQES